MIVDTITINGMPYTLAEEGIGAANEFDQHVNHWQDQHPRLNLGQLHEVNPALARTIMEGANPVQASSECVEVSTSVHASFYVNLTTGTLELIDIDLTGYDPDEFTDVTDGLNEQDSERAREIASSLGHSD